MTEAEARAVFAVRALDLAPSPVWSEADATWASAEARRAEGEHAPFERFVVRRAALAVARVAQRERGFDATLAALHPQAWVGWAMVLAALVLGFATDALGPQQRINILAPPLLALLAWNLVVYVVLLLPTGKPLRAWLAKRSLSRSRAVEVGSREAPLRAAAAVRWLPDWLRASAPLQGARIALVLHAAASALVIGALCSLYLRGIAFEYRAGWDSTFLEPAAVQRLIALVLGPASALTGLPLPDAARLAELRFSAGNGENAAAWIHLYAVTMVFAVVVPRAVLAALAVLRARALARTFPLALDDDYFARLRRAHTGAAVDVRVLPYSYRLGSAAPAALTAALERKLGTRVVLSLADTLPNGAEDDVQPWLGAPTPLTVVLFPLTTTPERETHGAFVRALAAHPSVKQVAVLIDEAEFRRRFTGAEGERRRAERQSAWQRLLDESDLAPEYVDLGAASA